MQQEKKTQIFSSSQKDLWRLISPSIWTLDSGHASQDPALSILQTLFDQPRWLEAHHLYDERGSHLFEKICELEEYYPTRTEDSILERAAERVIALAPVECIVELGAGFSKKSLRLLAEQARQRHRGTFVPVDVSLTGLSASREVVREKFPELAFYALQARFEEAIASIERSLPTLFVFLGGTVGNFNQAVFTRFFQHLSQNMGPGDFLLLGIDRVKESQILEQAYNDSQGVTAEFILNAFQNINRILQANFAREKMRYHSWYNPRWQQVEMYAVSACRQEIRFPPLRASFLWEEGDRILVEISRKFEPRRLQRQLQFFGLRPIEHFTDPHEWFSLLLFQKSGRPHGRA